MNSLTENEYPTVSKDSIGYKRIAKKYKNVFSKQKHLVTLKILANVIGLPKMQIPAICHEQTKITQNNSTALNF